MSQPEEPTSRAHDDDLHNVTQEIVFSQTLTPEDCLVGRFQIQSIQGRGSYGVVYRAYDKQLATQVAIKVLHPSLSKNQQAIINFKNELLLVRQLSHPNIIRVHEYYQQDTLHFITMDWIEGKSLDVAMAGQRPSTDEILSIISQLLQACEFAQQAGVTHRDIKPENILLDDAGRIYITDFGLSVLGTSSDSALISATFNYAPPEYLLSGKINLTTDLYAVGVICYQLICQCLPYAGTNLETLIKCKLLGTTNFPVSDPALVRLKPWVLSLIAAQPSARPQNITAALTRFIHCQDNRHSIPSYTKNYTVIAFILLCIMAVLWFVEPKEPIAQQQKDYFAIAIVPTTATENEFTQTFSDYLNYQLAEIPYLRVVKQNRLEQLITQLGITMPLTDAKIELIIDLLQVDALVNYEVVNAGSQQKEINFELVFAEGFKIQRERLLKTTFDDKQWRNSTKQLLTTMQQRINLTESHDNELLYNEDTLKALIPIKNSISNGQFEHAQRALTGLLEKVPTSPHFWLQQGELFLRQNLILEAEQAYAKASEFSTASTYTAKLSRARLNDLAGKIAQAKTDYLSLVNAFPYNIELKMMLAEFYMLIEQHYDMEMLLLDVVTLDPHHPNAWFMLGKAAFLQGQFDKALDEYFVKALVTAKKLKNLYQEGEALNAFGVVYGQQGEIQLAFDYYQQALTARTAAGNLAGAATTMTNLAAMHLSIGEFSKAKGYLKQSLTIYQQLDDQEGLSNSYNELGVLAEEQARYGEALDYFRQALNIRIDLNNQMLQAESMNNIGFMYFMLQDAEHALVYWRQAEQLYQQVQFPLGIVHVRQSIGQLELAKGNWRNAYHLFNNALKDAEQLNSIEETLVSRSYLSQLAFLQGNFQASFGELSSVYEQANNLQDVRAMAECGLWLADWALQLGDSNEANTYLNKIAEIVNAYGNKEHKSKFQFLIQQRENIQSTSVNDFQLPENIDIAHQALLLRQAMNKARIALQQGQRDIAVYLDPLATVNFGLYQYLYIEYLELLAIQQYFTANWTGLKETLRTAELLLRKMGGYWRSFQFDRLRAQLAIANQQAPEKYYAIVNKKLNDLSANLPIEQQKLFLSHLDYFDLQDSLQEFIRNDK